MAHESTYPGTIDAGGNLRALVATMEPSEAYDFLRLLADAVSEIQKELGVNPSGAAATVADAIAALAGGGGGGGGRTGVDVINEVEGAIDLQASTAAHIIVEEPADSVGIVLPDPTTAGAFLLTLPGAYQAPGITNFIWQSPIPGDMYEAVDMVAYPSFFDYGTALMVPGKGDSEVLPRWHCFVLTVAADVRDMDYQRQSFLLETWDADWTFSREQIGLALGSTGADARTMTVPPQDDESFQTNDQVRLVQMGTGSFTIAAGAGVTINCPPGKQAVLAHQYAEAHLFRHEVTDVWIITGELLDA